MIIKFSKALLLIFIGCFQFSCIRQKLQKSIAEIPKNDSETADSLKITEIPIKLEINETDFSYLKLKSKIDLKSENITQSFPANVHVKKDSIIWISVSVGIEAARCVITPDSIRMLDRINKKYYELSIAELSRKFGFDFDFGLLQSLLVGNLPIARKPSDRVLYNSLYTSLVQQAKNMRIENQIDNVNHKLSTILAQDVNGKSKLGISYTEFMEVAKDKLVPHAIFSKIDVAQVGGLKTTTLNFRHTRFEFVQNDLRFPFSVPKSYQKGEIVF